jgi:hypothetical protein
MKTYWGVDVYIHVSFTPAQVGGEGSASRLSSFTPGERAPGTHWIGGWVGPRFGLDDVERRKFFFIIHPTIPHYMCDNMSVVKQ